MGDTLSPNVGRVTLGGPPRPHRRFPFSFLLAASRRGCPSAAPVSVARIPHSDPHSLRTSSRGVLTAGPLRCNGSRTHFPGVCRVSGTRAGVPPPRVQAAEDSAGSARLWNQRGQRRSRAESPWTHRSRFCPRGLRGHGSLLEFSCNGKERDLHPRGPGAAASRHGAASCPPSCGVSPSALSGHGDGGSRRGADRRLGSVSCRVPSPGEKPG